MTLHVNSVGAGGVTELLPFGPVENWFGSRGYRTDFVS